MVRGELGGLHDDVDDRRRIDVGLVERRQHTRLAEHRAWPRRARPGPDGSCDRRSPRPGRRPDPTLTIAPSRSSCSQWTRRSTPGEVIDWTISSSASVPRASTIVSTARWAADAEATSSATPERTERPGRRRTALMATGKPIASRPRPPSPATPPRQWETPCRRPPGGGGIPRVEVRIARPRPRDRSRAGPRADRRRAPARFRSPNRSPANARTHRRVRGRRPPAPGRRMPARPNPARADRRRRRAARRRSAWWRRRPPGGCSPPSRRHHVRPPERG